jgi:hypothetical protein
MSAARIMLTYAVLGPLLGATVVLAGVLATEPALLRDGLVALAAFVFLFALPFAFPQSLAAGMAHVLAVRHFNPGKPALICVSAATGAVSSIVVMMLMGNLEKVFGSAGGVFHLLLLPVVSAKAIVLLLERGRRGN